MSYNPLNVRCPECFALAKTPCSGLASGIYHDQRVDLAYMISDSGEPMPEGVIEKAAEDLV